MAGRCQLDTQQCPRCTKHLVCTNTTAIGLEIGAYSGNVWRSNDCGVGLFAISGDSYVDVFWDKSGIYVLMGDDRGRKLRD